MTLQQIDEILNGIFADDEDRNYWIKRREEIAAKMERIAENENYFNKMTKYNR